MGWFSGGGSSGSSGGGGTVLFDSTLGVAAASIDSGAGGFATTYKVLRVYITARSANAAALPGNLNIRVNNDSGANYDQENNSVVNAAASLGAGTAQTSWQTYVPGAGNDASTAGSHLLEIPSYADTTFFKTGILVGGVGTATAASNASRFAHCRWRSTSAITRVAIGLSTADNLVAGSRLTIIGI